MKRFFYAFLAFFGASLVLTAAEARVFIHVDLSTQTMSVQSSSGSYVWPVSTARSGYSTPRGSYAPTSLQTMHYSRKYHMSPMPHSIFFRGGYAIHGTYATSALGSPASHGCVRLAPAEAAALFQMVKAEGASISISGSPPNRAYASARHKHRSQVASSGHHRHRVHYAGNGHHKHRAHFAARRHHSAPLAYAPSHRHGPGSVRSFQRNPAFWD